MTGLVDSTVLARLSLGFYVGRKLDKKVSADIAYKEGVADRIGRLWKDTLPFAELDRIKAISQRARQLFYQYSSPWAAEGIRIMPIKALYRMDSRQAPTYDEQYRRVKNEFEQAVNVFLDRYPDLVRKAARELKGLYNPNDYPSEEAMRRKFFIRMDYTPMPTVGDFRIQLVEDQMAELRRSVEEQLHEAHAVAMKDLWQRIGERVTKLHETLSDPNARFNDNTIEGLTEFCEHLSRLNYANDPELEAIRLSVQSDLATLHPDALRADNVDPNGYRSVAARKAEEILKRVRAMGG